MYPELVRPLTFASVVALASLLYVAVRRPVTRRLALKQFARRRNEAVLAVAGASLGMAIIIASLVVGDTLGFSVRQDAYRVLGPIDERVATGNSNAAKQIELRLFLLRVSPDVDGVVSAGYAQAAVTAGAGSTRAAEPRAVIWNLDFSAAAAFGSAGGPSGISGPSPTGDGAVVNQPLAHALGVGVGDAITVHLGSRSPRVLITRVLPERGLAGAGPSNLNRSVYVSPEVFSMVRPASVQGVTFVSNEGGVESGAALTDSVVKEIHAVLGPLAKQVLVDTPKRDVLQAADRTAASLGAVFLMIGSFSIIAGALLLVNIFVMLGDERKTQLGMLRAVGMSRSGVAGALSLEGALYSILAIVPGIGLGLGVGWAVARIAGVIFRSFGVGGSSLQVSFAVSGTSIVNGVELGMLIGIAAIAATSLRISRFNIIAAVRDLQNTGGPRGTRRLVIVTMLSAVVLAGAAIPVVVSSQAQGSYLLPSLAAACTVPALRSWLGGRWAVSAVASVVLAWCLALPVIRPRIFDDASMTVFVIEGTLIAASAVALVSQNQSVLLAPLLRLRRSSAQTALAIRLAGAYPLAKRFRTSATLIMYTLITLVLVLLVEITGVFESTIQSQTDQITAGFGLRIDVAPGASNAVRHIAASVAPHGPITGDTMLTTAVATASDPGHRTSAPLHAIAVGVDAAAMQTMHFDARMPGLRSDAAVWQRIAANPQYVAIDAFFGSAGGPPGHYYSPGDRFEIRDPRTDAERTVFIAGVMNSATVFYPYASTLSGTFPVVGSTTMVRQLFGRDAAVSGALLRLHTGTSAAALAAQLQARNLAAGLVATQLAPAVRDLFAANVAFFRLMQGFLGLGLLVGVAGIGVVMIRSVHERRRTIGMLRALGTQARTVRGTFLLESGFIAGEGVALGSILGVITTWLMYKKSAQFAGFHVPFPVEWTTVTVLAVVTLIASLLATVGPARRAAAIRPAIAVRIAD